MSRLIQTAVIGFGLSGKVFHAPFIHTHRGFHLATVVERNHNHSRETYPYVRVVKDYKELLTDDNIELIVVATPNIYHYTMAREAMLSGKHVIIEKPFAPSVFEANDLIEISADTGKKIFVYHNRRWDGDFLTIKNLMEEGHLGEINYYEAHFDRFSPDLKPGAWRDEDIPGGGILFDLGSHLIDQVLVLFGMPNAIRAEINKERIGSPVDDSFLLELIYPEMKAVLTAGMMVKKPGPRFIIKGSDGSFIKQGIDPQEAALKDGQMPEGDLWGVDHEHNYGIFESYLEDGPPAGKVKTRAGNYMAFYDNVYEALVKNKPVMVLPQTARDVILIIEKAFESHRKDKMIKL